MKNFWERNKLTVPFNEIHKVDGSIEITHQAKKDWFVEIKSLIETVPSAELLGKLLDDNKRTIEKIPDEGASMIVAMAEQQRTKLEQKGNI